MGWLDAIGGVLGGGLGAVGGGLLGGSDWANNLVDPDKWKSGINDAFGLNGSDPTNQDRNALRGIGQQGAQGYAQNQLGLNQSINQLQGIANGQNSVSAEQLRQGNQQALAAQMAMAAGAAPQNAAMAARNAAMNMGRLQYGLSGQQAVAGLQERNQAMQQLGQLRLGQAGQNLQAGLGGYGAALGHPMNTGSQMLQGLLSSAMAAGVKGA